MTSQEMINSIRLGVQTLDSFTFEDAIDEELLIILNQMQDKFVKKRFYEFESNNRRLHDLQSLVRSKSYSTGDTIAKGSVVFDLPDNYLFYISGECSLEDNSDTYTGINLDIVNRENLNELLRNPFRTSTINNLISTIGNDQLEVFTQEKFILVGLNLSYIKTPSTIELALPCELPEHTHNNIVDMAIQNILEKIESPRYQTNINENINND